MDRVEIPRPSEEGDLARRLREHEVGLVFGARYVGKETLIVRAVRQVPELSPRPIWVDLSRPDPSAPVATLRNLCDTLLTGADAGLRAGAAEARDVHDTVKLLRRAELGRRVVVFWLGPRSFARGALPFMNGLYHRLQSAWLDGESWAPRLILSGDLLEDHWSLLRNGGGGLSQPVEDGMAYLGNKSQPIIARPFDRAQTDALLEALGLLPHRGALEEALRFLGGHPHLLNMALRSVVSRDIAPDALLRSMRLTRGGPIAPFFSAMYRAIIAEGIYSDAMVLAEGGVPDDPFARIALESWGLGVRPHPPLFEAVAEGFRKAFLLTNSRP